MTLHVFLPDGSSLELPDGATVADAAAAIGPRLAKAAIAGRVTPAGMIGEPGDEFPAGAGSPQGEQPAPEGRLVDLAHTLYEGDKLAIVTAAGDDGVGLDIIRHSTSHVLAQAILRLYPGTKYAIGPTIENGFYYDFLFPGAFSEADLSRVEEEMRKIVRENLPVERHELRAGQAIERFITLDQNFKVELIEDLVSAADAEETAAEAAGVKGTAAAVDVEVEGQEAVVEGGELMVSAYTQGEFLDLCRGPHVPTTGKIGTAFKLTSVAGAYWRGDERRPMLTRIYGTAWASQKDLDAYMKRLEMARQRDHRRLGRDLDLFSFHEEGPGFPFFHPKGMRLWNAMIDFWRAEHVKAGYEEVRTPQILRRELWEKSGHWDNYKDNMYFTTIDGLPFAVKPMNCPGGMLIYKSRRRSYRDLPLRVAELGQVHRHEMSGVLHGLFRVRYFTQDDAHIYCTPEQLEPEVLGVLRFMLHIYAAFGFSDVKIELSTRPEKSIGSDEMWAKAEGALRNVLESEGIDYVLNPGDGAFYGPKIDFHIRDVMGRTWQCGTIQADFAMPENLDVTYTGADNEEHRPVMIHRALLGSIERFMGILLEHYGGNLPTWLAPEQVRILPIADRHAAYAHQVKAQFEGAAQEAGVQLWVYVDDRSESLGKRIREGQVQKVPFLLIVGDREAQEHAVAVRERGKDRGTQPIDEVVTRILDEIRERVLPVAEEAAEAAAAE